MGFLVVCFPPPSGHSKPSKTETMLIGRELISHLEDTAQVYAMFWEKMCVKDI